MKTLLLITILTISSIASTLPTQSVIKIFVSASKPDYQYPWQTSQREQSSGSGVIIKDNYIITNAHVISDAKFIQVKKDNSSKKYIAKIKYVSHQADLALLEVKDKTFFTNTKPLSFTQKVSTGDNVTVFGFPIGGDSLSTTKGVVSRIEPYSYVWSHEKMLAIQVDASINSGNSGGAAVNSNNEIIGIVMQSLSNDETDNIGYIIPSLIVNTFLEDIKDNKVDGYDNGSIKIQKLNNEVLKEYYNIKDNQGVAVYKTEKSETSLKVGDIILEIENKKVSNDETVQTQYGKQKLNYYFHTKPVGDTIALKIRRDIKVLNIDYTLKRKHEIIKKELFKEPRYIVFGGLVFSPLTENYLKKLEVNPLLFKIFYELKDKAKHAKEGVIVLADKFEHNVNESYSPYAYMVHTVNGIKVKDFNHFVNIIDNIKDKYTVIDFLYVADMKYVFNTKEARESFEEIKNIYGLNTDRRVE